MNKASWCHKKLSSDVLLSEKEEGLVQLLSEFGTVVKQAGKSIMYLIGNYVYDLAKEFNQFYHEHPILREENGALRDFRLVLA